LTCRVASAPFFKTNATGFSRNQIFHHLQQLKFLRVSTALAV
jgi:hypothetical protein